MRRLTFLLLWLVSSPLQDTRLPVPSEESTNRAEKTIRDIFKEDYAVRTSTAQQKLARKLIEQGRETKDDDILRFVLFREAGDLAAKAGDIETVIRAVEVLSQTFRVDGLVLRSTSFSKAEAAASRPEDFRKLSEAQLKLVYDCIDADQPALAGRVAQATLGTAKKSKDLGLAGRAEATLKSIPEVSASMDKAKKSEQILLTAPDDSAANQTWGEYLCMMTGRWALGLPFLSKGPDSALKTLAQKELSQPSELPVLLDLADGWWDLSEKEKHPLRRRHLQAHATAFCQRVLPMTSGLTQIRLSKRLTDVERAGTSFRVNREGLVVWWTFDEGKGETISNGIGTENKGTLKNGVEWAAGRQGMALSFNGTSSYVECKEPKLPAMDAPQTIAWWQFHHSIPQGTETFICLLNVGKTAAIQAGTWAGKVTVWRWGRAVLAAGPILSQNAWHHCAYVFDGKSSLLYVDGTLENTTQSAPQSATVTGFELGRWGGIGGPGEHCSGVLDDVRIYKRALSEKEIQGLASGNE